MPIPILMEDFKPTVDIPENMHTGLGNKKIGQKIKAIVDYTVIEETKSFVVLRVNGFFLSPARRSF